MTYKQYLAEQALMAIGGPSAAAGYIIADQVRKHLPKKKSMAPYSTPTSVSKKRKNAKQCGRLEGFKYSLRPAKRGGKKSKRRKHGSYPGQLQGKKTVKSVEPVHADNMHSGVTGTVVKVQRAGIKFHKYDRKMPNWGLTWSYQQHLQPLAGKQTVFDALQIGTCQQFINGTALPLSTFDVSPTAFFDMNPNQKLTGSGKLTAGYVPQNDQIILKSYESRWMITSMSGSAAILTMYVLTPKVVTNKLPAILWGTAVLDEGENIATQTFPTAGFGAFGTVGSEDITNLYAKPTDFQRFRDYWKIVAVKDVRLEGNATELINFDFKIHKNIHKSKIYEIVNQFGGGANNAFIPGVTHCIMMVLHGVPVIDTTNAGAHVVSTGSPNIAFTYSQKVHLHGVPAKGDRISTFLSYSQVPSGATTANQAMITEVDAPSTVNATTQT